MATLVPVHAEGYYSIAGEPPSRVGGLYGNYSSGEPDSIRNMGARLMAIMKLSTIE